MTITPRLLDADLLAEFEAALRIRRIDTDALSPGLTDAQIDDIVEPWGLRLPNEVRAWWRWHNGGPPRKPVYLLPRRVMLDLNAGIQSHAYDARSGREEFADPPRGVQPVDWSPTIFVQCVATGSAAAPVYVVHDPAARSRLVLPSFGELVHTWLELLARGVYATRPEGGWNEAQSYPPDVVSLGIA